MCTSCAFFGTECQRLNRASWSSEDVDAVWHFQHYIIYSEWFFGTASGVSQVICDKPAVSSGTGGLCYLLTEVATSLFMYM